MENTITYRVCESIISGNRYKTKEDIQTKLDVFYIGNRITQSEYETLSNLLKAQQV